MDTLRYVLGIPSLRPKKWAAYKSGKQRKHNQQSSVRPTGHWKLVFVEASMDSLFVLVSDFGIPPAMTCVGSACLSTHGHTRPGGMSSWPDSHYSGVTSAQ
jgi:hypothetical protein